jgi:hypothetical protein
MYNIVRGLGGVYLSSKTTSASVSAYYCKVEALFFHRNTSGIDGLSVP